MLKFTKMIYILNKNVQMTFFFFFGFVYSSEYFTNMVCKQVNDESTLKTV